MSDIIPNPRNKYYLDHRDELLIKAKDRYKKNKKSIKEYNQRYYSKNKDIINSNHKRQRKRRVPYTAEPQPPRMIVIDNAEDIIVSFA